MTEFGIPGESTMGEPGIYSVPPITSDNTDLIDLGELRSQVWELARINSEIKRLTVDKDRIEAKLRLAVGDKIGCLDGQRVFSYQGIDRFAAKRFQDEMPELAQHFLVTRTVEEIDVDFLRKARPDLYDKYRARQTKFTFTS